MRRVTAFAGTRADLSPLGPVLVALAARDDVDLTVITALGLTPSIAPPVLADVGLDPSTYRHVALPVEPAGDAPTDLARAGGALALAVSDFVAASAPEVLVVLGDRWELLWVVPTFVVARVPVVHLHGGEVTEGAIDERVRHAITKLADEHCVATARARERLLAMGESAAHVHLTGAPGLDRLASAMPMAGAEFAETFGRPLTRPLVLLTYHPVTSGDEPPGATAEALLDALGALGALTVVTDPGLDAGREAILDAIASREKDESLIHVPSLGRLYPRLLKTVDAVVGNSSSGIIEAPFVGVPTIDVGVRQTGRERGPSVRWSPAEPTAVLATIGEVLRADKPDEATSLMYGRGDAAALIAAIAAKVEGARPKPLVLSEVNDQ